MSAVSMTALAGPVIELETAPVKSLVSKLAEVMAAVYNVPKRGRNDFHKYDYATEADIAATVRAELAARHVLLIPSIVGETRHSVGEKGSWLTVLEMEMEFLDGESNESIKKPWRGYGSDKDDKGGYKGGTANTGIHRPEGIFMSYGPDVRAHRLGAAPTVWDIAPTILHMLNLPIPSYMDGAVMKEIFRDESGMAIREIKKTGYEAARIKSKLRSLKKDK